jgi:hypothetical protein
MMVFKMIFSESKGMIVKAKQNWLLQLTQWIMQMVMPVQLVLLVAPLWK